MPPSNLLLASKVVVVEEPPRIRNIQGAPTAIAAFSGVTERGPVRVPQFTTSFDEWQEIYGGFIAESDLALAVEGFFRNGGLACWTSRVVHYTDINDPNSFTALPGVLDVVDRGGAPTTAILDSADGPFDLEPGEQLDVNIDGAGTDSLVFSATAAMVASGNTEPFALVNGDTLVYQVKQPGSTTLSEQRTITFTDADPLIAAIGAATAQELVNFINRDGIGISAVVNAGAVEIYSDKRGSGAELLIDAASTAISAGKLNIASGSTVGTGNVADIDAVTATEVAGLLTGLPLSSGTATVVGSKVRLESTGTGLAADVVIEATTTALGIFAGALPITATGSDSGESPTLRFTAKDPGTHIESITVRIQAATNGESDRFNLTFLRNSSVQESWPNLSMNPADARYVEDFVTTNSILLDVLDLLSPATPPANLPKIGDFTGFAGADDGLVGLADIDYTGSQAGQTGLFAFDLVSQITLLAVPGRATSAVHNAMIQYCEVERVGQCFAVLDPPEGLDEQGIKTYVETTAAIAGLSEFAAIYWPNVKILNPSAVIFGPEENIVVPPSGHILGMYSRTDASIPGGVYEPPAGVEKGILFGVLGFETDDVLDERKRDVVYPVRINPITAIDGSPRHVDGSRTLKGDGNFPSVSERRGVIFIETSLKKGLLFAKHRKNNRKLRQEVKRTIQTFLLRQFNVDAFRGDTASESFFVDVSDALNPPEEEFAGRLNVRIGLATVKPAEFIILRFTQDTRALEERLANQLGG